MLIADLGAGCSLAESINADQLRAWKAEHPGAKVVMYVNTSAEVKAETDYCCTSSNAVAVVEHVWEEHGEDTEILFGPDMWLGASSSARPESRRTRAARPVPYLGRRVPCPRRDSPQGHHHRACEHPNAEFLIHPECGCATQAMEYVAAGDIDPDGVHALHRRHAQLHGGASRRRVHRRHRERDAAPAPAGRTEGEAGRGQPDGLLQVHEDDHPAEGPRLLRDFKYEVKVPPEIAKRATVPIERMVAIG